MFNQIQMVFICVSNRIEIHNQGVIFVLLIVNYYKND